MKRSPPESNHHGRHGRGFLQSAGCWCWHGPVRVLAPRQEYGAPAEWQYRLGISRISPSDVPREGLRHRDWAATVGAMLRKLPISTATV